MILFPLHLFTVWYFTTGFVYLYSSLSLHLFSNMVATQWSVDLRHGLSVDWTG